MALQVKICCVEGVACHADVFVTEVIEIKVGESGEVEDSVERHSNRGVYGIGERS